MNATEFDATMRALLAAWPHSFNRLEADRLADTFELGETLLGHLEGGAVMGAIADLVLEGREHAPPMGLIAKRAGELAASANGERVPDVEEALREVYDRISRVGTAVMIYNRETGEAHNRLHWSHPAIASAVEAMGGWEAVCASENPEALRAHFLRLYGTARSRVERVALTEPLLARIAPGLSLSADRALGESEEARR